MQKVKFFTLMLLINFIGLAQAEKDNKTLYSGLVKGKPQVKIASFNIQASRAKSMQNIVAAIKKIDADIIGLQEVDNKTNRSAMNFSKKGSPIPIDQAKYIAEKNKNELFIF